MSAVQRLAKVAKRSGAAEVHAVARHELAPVDLGRLLLHLRRVDSDWRLPLKERRRLAVELVEADVSDSKIIEQTEISRTTLWRIRRDLVDKPNRARELALQRGESVSNRSPLTRRSFGRILHVEGSSGNSDFDAVARLLGGAS
jgi:hypothetical protein